MGGGARYSLSALPGNHRSLVCNRLQMGTTRTSDARETDSMREVIGIDSYNLCSTGGVAKTMTAGRNDKSNIPCVLIQGGCYTLDEKMGQTYVHNECANTLAQRDYKQPQVVIYELSTEDRPSDGEQPSWELLRTRRI